MMKKIAISLAAILLASTFGAAETVTLSSWKMKSGNSPKAWKAEVPATVAGVLDDNGYFGEGLLESDNYFKQDKSIFDEAWTFSTKFKTPKGENCMLRFNSLGYYADVELNGRMLASSDTTFGVFLVREYDITRIARKLRRNNLKVTLRRAQSGDLNHGFVDWNPRPLGENMGILGPVTVSTTGAAKIDDVFVIPELDVETLAEADLKVKASVRNLSGEPVEGVMKMEWEGGVISTPVTLQPGCNALAFSAENFDALHVDNPRVWWTWDLGTPEMYNMKVSFEESDGSVSDSRSVDFGIRSITSEIVDGAYRQFYLNGHPVLIKGAGWTDEIFFRDTHESNELQAQYVKDMNMNCIRFENIWGKDDSIYDCCDRLGIMAMVGWSCQWEWEIYCGLPESNGCGCITSPESMDLAVKYFHDQVIRLHNHPSIICWLTGSDCIPNEKLEERYMEIYNEYEYRPYVCSAKALVSRFGGHSGTKMAGPYEYVGPDYWYLDTELGGAFGFNTETGIGLNMPQLPSIRRMMPADSLWPLSKTWDLHCTASNAGMNSTGMLTAAMNGAYGQASTLEEFVNRGHAIDYDATRAMYEAFRCNIPRSTGIIQWMLNSAWPAMYWQLYDYYKVPTASYYGTRKACEPLQLIFNYKDRAVYAVNETGRTHELKAVVKLYDAASTLVAEEEIAITSADRKAERVYDVPASEGGLFLSLELLDAEDNAVADNFYCVPSANNEYDWEHAEWFYTPISKFADLTYVSALPEAEVEMTAEKEGDSWKVTLSNKSEVISYQNILQLTGADGQLITPAFWSDNFVTVLPGQTKVLSCKAPEGTAGEVKVQTWNTTIK